MAKYSNTADQLTAMAAASLSYAKKVDVEARKFYEAGAYTEAEAQLKLLKVLLVSLERTAEKLKHAIEAEEVVAAKTSEALPA